MKYLLALATILLMFACAPTPIFAQQTPDNTVCNEKTGLSWIMNSEADMAHYKIYVANMPGIENANPPVNVLVQVPHDPATAVIQPDGSKAIVYALEVTMAEGDKYFVVSALDQSGNESSYSNEIGCEYNTIPGAPTIKLIFARPKLGE